MTNLKISCVLPILGEVDIKLRKESAQIYSLLDKTIDIRRLKNLDQLGILKKKITCAHHPKFEYVLLLIYLIEMIQQDEKMKGKYPLSSNITSGGKVVISSMSELMKCWALLLPIGHLHGTFAHEKAILKIICTNNDFRHRFLSKFKNLDISKKIENIIDEENYYEFYKILAIQKLKNYRKRKTLKAERNLIDKALKYLSFYINPTKPAAIRTAREIFFTLRRISYVLLDSHYCHLLFSFHASDITIETIKLTLLQEEGESYISDFWSSLDNYLTRELYKNPSSIFIENLAYRALYSRMIRENKDIRLIWSQSTSHDYQYVEKTFNKHIMKNKISLEDKCFDKELKFSLSTAKLFNVEKTLDKMCKKNSSYDNYLNCEVDKDIRTKETNVHIFIKDKYKRYFTFQAFGSLLKELTKMCEKSQREMKKKIPPEIKKVFKAIDIPVSRMRSENWNTLLKFILGYILKSDIIFNLNHIHKQIDTLIFSKNTLNKKMKDKLHDIDNKEIEDLFTFANKLYGENLKQKIIVYPFNIKLRDTKSNEDRTDIDSVILTIPKRGKIRIYTLQSKKRRRRYSEAEAQALIVKRLLEKKFTSKKRSQIYKLPTDRNTKTAVLDIKLN